ncbi:S1 family peptidase [Bremerella alba]|uniref:Serine protease n=1 Tax=Bremerella alba TaxID=980252 RepID=A0A7V9A905_9BACT|nr:serine protease [Bremerella alba]MBA2116631.1 hypothetical protein [Bremerella alba]
MLIGFLRLLVLAPVLLLLFGSSVGAATQDANTQVFRATFKIVHKKSTATGFVLSPDGGKSFILITAAHVLDQTPGEQTTVVFRCQTGEGEYTKLPTQLVIRKGDTPLWVKHPTEDVAAISVKPPVEADLAVLSTDSLMTDDDLRALQVHPGERLTLLGYPHREESSEAGFPILRDGPLASFPLLPTKKTKTFYLSTNSFSGDSGGPVFVTRSGEADGPTERVPRILGLMQGQRLLNDTLEGSYITVKTRHQFGLANVIHSSLIIETIRLMK